MARTTWCSWTRRSPRTRSTWKGASSEAGIAVSRTRLIKGRALDVLPRLTDGAYDLVFVDAAQSADPKYLEGGELGGGDRGLADPVDQGPGAGRAAPVDRWRVRPGVRGRGEVRVPEVPGRGRARRRGSRSRGPG